MPKFTGGFFNADGNSINMPPINSVEMSIKDNKDWIEISYQEVIKQKTER